MKTLTKLALIGAVGIGACWMLALAQDSSGPSPIGDRPPNDMSPPAGPGHRMHDHPLPLLIRTLDTNGDGIIDANEIANASAALQKLDKNGDGQLTPDEYMGPPPPPPLGPAGELPKEILDKYDVNKDGKLDETERAALRKDIEDGKVPLPPRRR